MTVVNVAAKTHLEGVNVSVDVDGERALVWERGKDGYIFQLAKGDQASIWVNIDRGYNIWGLIVKGSGDIDPLKNYAQDIEDRKIYWKKIPIHRNKNEAFTLYNENHLCLSELFDDGYFAIYKIAIVFQNGLGFLTIHRVYEGFVFKSGKGLFCPEFDGKWPQLIAFLESIYKQNGIDNLSCFEGYNPLVKKADDIKLDDNVGIVKWFDVARGFGAISTNKGDAFVHYKDIDSPERLVCLDIGDMVLFEKLIPNAYIKTGFAYKAVGVLAPEA